MTTSAVISERLESTSIRGWAVLVLNRFQMSSVVLSSFVFGVFLPFITEDLGLTPLEAGLLQGVWWGTSALTVIPFSVWFSRFRPVYLVLASLVLLTPFVFMQGMATNFLMLFLARFFTVGFQMVGLPGRPMLFKQWVAPRQYAQVNAAGLSLHALLLAVAVSTSALLIAVLGSWRLAYAVQGVFLILQIVVWLFVARESKAPVKLARNPTEDGGGSPFGALKAYPHGWLIGVMWFALGATWTSVVTFLPTLLLQEEGVAVSLGGPILAFMYYGLIPGALLSGYINSKVTNRKLLLLVPAIFNVVFGIAVALTSNLFLVAVFLSGIGLVWMAIPAIEMLPFEYPGIRPREASVLFSMFFAVSAAGFAVGPMIVGAVAQGTGSLQAGLVVISLVTIVGVVAALFYPSRMKDSRDIFVQRNEDTLIDCHSE